MAQRISQLKGVGLVSISGGQRPAVRVQANPTALASYGLSMETLRSALASANVNQAKGNFDGLQQAWTINDNDQIQGSADYKKVILAYRNGAPVRFTGRRHGALTVWENTKQAAWVNSTPAIILNIQRPPGKQHYQRLSIRFRATASADAGLDAGRHQDSGDHRSDHDASGPRWKTWNSSLSLTIVLVVAVIFAFLRSFSATIIPGIAVPLSLIGTFAVMYLLGIQSGQPVADGAHYFDRICGRRGHRHDREYFPLHRNGLYAPWRRRSRARREIGFTVVSLTVSLIAVLIPLLFMADIVGRLFREFAVTLCGSHDFLGLRFSHPDPHDGGPAFCGTLRKINRGSCSTGRKCCICEDHRWDTVVGKVRFVLRHQAVTLLWSRWELSRQQFTSTSSFPRVSSRCRIQASCWGSQQAPETISFPGHGDSFSRRSLRKS